MDENPFPLRLELLAKRYNQSGTLGGRGVQATRYKEGQANREDTRMENKKRDTSHANRARRQGNLRPTHQYEDGYRWATGDLQNPEFDGGPRLMVANNPATKYYPAADTHEL